MLKEITNQVKTPKPPKEKVHKAPATVGNIFEKTIQDTNNIYKELKLAYIQRNATPTRFIPPMKGKAGFLMHVAKTGFDFVGCYREHAEPIDISDSNNGIIASCPIPNWKPVFIEAKTTKEGRIDIWADKSGIKIHQIYELQYLEEMGLEAFILWHCRDANMIFKFTVSQMLEVTGEKKSISLIDCEDNNFTRCIWNQYQGKMHLDYLRLLE